MGCCAPPRRFGDEPPPHRLRRVVLPHDGRRELLPRDFAQRSRSPKASGGGSSPKATRGCAAPHETITPEGTERRNTRTRGRRSGPGSTRSSSSARCRHRIACRRRNTIGRGWRTGGPRPGTCSRGTKSRQAPCSPHIAGASHPGYRRSRPCTRTDPPRRCRSPAARSPRTGTDPCTRGRARRTLLRSRPRATRGRTIHRRRVAAGLSRARAPCTAESSPPARARLRARTVREPQTQTQMPIF